MSSVVIYGGTFNPIHNGHISICDFVLENGFADKIILVPVANPPHKNAHHLVSADDRLEMCRLAVQKNRRIDVCDWEIQKGGKSYTIDTVSYLESLYPQDTFSLLIGTDMFLTFTQWRDWQLLASKVRLLVVSREQDDKNSLRAQQKLLAKAGVKSVLLDNPVVEISSTQIRAFMCVYGNMAPVPDDVRTYIMKKDLYPFKDARDDMVSIIKPMLVEKRFQHSLYVQKRAEEMAVRYGADVVKASVAGVLHDICKNMPESTLLQMVQEYDTMTDINFASSPQLLHSYAGAIFIENQLGISDKDVLNAVRYHTTARAGMSVLEKIIYLADLTSQERDYPDVENMRRLADRDLNKAMLAALHYIVNDFLEKKDKLPCTDTMQALREYEEGLAQKEL